MSSFRFGSHLPVLMQAVRQTDGPILELGSGIYSTVYLHWACYHSKRFLRTLESKRGYYRAVRNLRCDWHDIDWVRDWDKADLSGDWSVVLVDESPGWQRPLDVKRLVDAEYIVIHDTDKETEGEYRYEEEGIYDLFKYRFDYRPTTPHTPDTTVLSNKHDLGNFMGGG